jgi:hypothetical protein
LLDVLGEYGLEDSELAGFSSAELEKASDVFAEADEPQRMDVDHTCPSCGHVF